MKVVVVDLECGNIGSLSSALRYLGAEHTITTKAEALVAATHVILPGVGAFDAAMQTMNRRGLVEPLRAYAAQGRPLFGVCLGMQLLFEGSEEGRLPGLSVMPGQAVQLKMESGSQWKVPHVGFAAVHGYQPIELFAGFGAESFFYFTHSYAIPTLAGANVGRCNHARPFVAAFQCGMICGAQFHPEKSQAHGLRAISNFLGIGSAQ